MTKAPEKSQKPQKVVRKLTLSKEKVAQLTRPDPTRKCTILKTGCPAHTC
jgi:hypothetical protein